jgi:hypothetical protein
MQRSIVTLINGWSMHSLHVKMFDDALKMFDGEEQLKLIIDVENSPHKN